MNNNKFRESSNKTDKNAGKDRHFTKRKMKPGKSNPNP